MSAIEWLIEPFPLTDEDFFNREMPVTISGIIDGISEEIIGKMPKTQQGQIRPYVADAKLHFRQRMEKPGGAKTAKLEVRNPKPVDPTLPWTENPTGIQPALAALFPESIRIDAMDDAGADVAKQTQTNKRKLLHVPFAFPNAGRKFNFNHGAGDWPCPPWRTSK